MQPTKKSKWDQKEPSAGSTLAGAPQGGTSAAAAEAAARLNAKLAAEGKIIKTEQPIPVRVRKSTRDSTKDVEEVKKFRSKKRHLDNSRQKSLSMI